MKFIVQLTSGVPMWIAPWSGDPGRTLDIDNAQKYKTLHEATIALAKARRYSQFREAKIIAV